MATLGQKAATQHVSLQKQTITGNGGTSYTLQQSVGSALDVAVFVNNTRQEPTIAYSASGTTLTMTGAVNASDSFYVIFLGKAITTTGLPVDAVGTANINANAVTMDKLATSGTLPALNGSALTGISNAGLVRFSGNLASTISLSRGVTTQITGFTNNEIDSHSAFDGSSFTVPAGQGGVYYICNDICVDYDAVGDDGELWYHYMYKNGSTFQRSQVSDLPNGGRIRWAMSHINSLITLSAGDVIKIYVQSWDTNGGGGGQINHTDNMGRFFGFRLA